MFRLLNKQAPFPPLYEHVERKKGTVKDKGWDKVGDFVLRDRIDLIPQEGLQEDLCRCNSNLIFVVGEATSGKCAPIDSHVLTPDGFVLMGSLKKGDVVIGSDGGHQIVEEIFEQPEKEIFRFTMADGATAETSADHLWLVAESRWKKASVTATKTTEQIIKDFEESKRKAKTGAVHNILFPMNGPVQFKPKGDLRIDPYLLGAILGDGCTRIGWNRIGFYTEDQEVLDRFVQKGLIPYHTKNQKNFEYFISDKPLCDDLRRYGLYDCLSYDKFIPEDYKYASIEARKELLRGLFDTDGSCTQKGIEYSTSSETLANDIVFLLRSLGILCKRSEKNPQFTYNGVKKHGHVSYRISVYISEATDIFTLPRKLKNHNPNINKKGYKNAHYLKDIQKVGIKPCRCIQVSNPNHLYIMDDFLVTHNTYGMMLKALNGVGKTGYTGRLINVRKLDSAKGTSMFRDASEVWGNFSNCEVTTGELPTFAWRKWNNAIQMIHANFNSENPKEWDEFQEYIKKQQSSYICIDEATAIEEFRMFSYIFSRNRDSSGITPTMVLAFNFKHFHWTTDFLVTAGYIGKDWYLKPEMIGATRYFYIKGDDATKIIWGDSKEEVARAADIHINEEDREAGLTELDMVKSFTLFSGHASGNRKLVAATGGQSVANLHAVGGAQRRVLAEGYAGPIDENETSVTEQMIRDMMTNPEDADENMYGTLDVSGGDTKSDNCPLIIWKGLRIIAIELFHGDPKELVEWIDTMLQRYNIPVKNFAFDATGIGNYLKAFTAGYPITANKTALQEYDENGNAVTLEQYFNLSSQLLGKMKVLFETGAISTSMDLEMRIPYGKKGEKRRILDILYNEINIFVATTRNKRIYYRSKDEYKTRYKSSPDLMDAICLRAIWELDARPKKQPEPEIEEDAYEGLFNDYSGGRSVVYV